MSISRLIQMGAAGKSTVWNPLQLSFIDAWYDVSDYSTITETSGNVTALADKTSNNYDLSYAGTSPVYSSTGWDGSLPAIEFSGSVFSALRSSTRLTQADITIAAVYDTDTTDSLRRSFGIVSYSNSNNKDTFALASDNSLRFDGAFASGSITAATGKFLRVANVNSSTMYDFINGSQNISGSVTSGLATDGYISMGEVVTALDLSSYTFDGRMAEAVVCIGTLSQSDREKLEGYFAHRWGIESSLPSGHPYKSSPPS
jgi:hypothetical protein